MRLRKLARDTGFKLTRWGMNASHYDMARNGEAHLLKRLSSRSGIETAIDIGMNSGAWSAHLKGVAPEAVVHGVEPVPEFAERCRARQLDGVTVHELAISSEPGEITIYRKGHGARSTDFGAKPGALTPYTVRALTGDTLFGELGLAALSIIKIDTDGNDFPALQGFSETLRRKRPVVQFEYGRFWIGTRHYLADAYALLEPLGYRLGPLLPAGVLLGKYEQRNENFQNCNYVAVPEEHSALSDLAI